MLGDIEGENTGNTWSLPTMTMFKEFTHQNWVLSSFFFRGMKAVPTHVLAYICQVIRSSRTCNDLQDLNHLFSSGPGAVKTL